jgi:hypothetical protein
VYLRNTSYSATEHLQHPSRTTARVNDDDDVFVDGRQKQKGPTVLAPFYLFFHHNNDKGFWMIGKTRSDVHSARFMTASEAVYPEQVNGPWSVWAGELAVSRASLPQSPHIPKSIGQTGRMVFLFGRRDHPQPCGVWVSVLRANAVLHRSPGTSMFGDGRRLRPIELG